MRKFGPMPRYSPTTPSFATVLDRQSATPEYRGIPRRPWACASPQWVLTGERQEEERGGGARVEGRGRGRDSREQVGSRRGVLRHLHPRPDQLERVGDQHAWEGRRCGVKERQ